MGRYKSNNNVIYNCHYRVVFTPKYRRSVLINGVDVRLKNIIADECSALGASLIEIEVMPDHVHCFVEVTSTEKSPHQIVARLKGYSSRFLRKEFKELKSKLPAMWTRSYYIGSVGHVSKETIEQYIKNQKNV